MLISLMKLKNGEGINKDLQNKINLIGYASIFCIFVKILKSKKYRIWLKNIAIGTVNASIMSVSILFVAFMIIRKKQKSEKSN